MNHLANIVGAMVVAGSLATPATACSIILPYGSPFDQRLSSKRVEAQANCAFENGGVRDGYRGGAAEDLGNGRVAQLTSEYKDEYLIVDCRRLESISVTGPIVGYADDSCGGPRFGALRKPEGALSLSEGDSLSAFVSIAHNKGARVHLNTDYLNTDPWGKPVWRKDRIDIFCGCKLFYPESAGAAQ